MATIPDKDEVADSNSAGPSSEFPEKTATKSHLPPSGTSDNFLSRRDLSHLPETEPGVATGVAISVNLPEPISHVDGLFGVPIIDSPPGIYFLCDGNSVVYVGQSICVIARIARHRVEGKKRFDRAFFVRCEPKKLDQIERDYINLLMPIYNTDFRTNHRRKALSRGKRLEHAVVKPRKPRTQKTEPYVEPWLVDENRAIRFLGIESAEFAELVRRGVIRGYTFGLGEKLIRFKFSELKAFVESLSPLPSPPLAKTGGSQCGASLSSPPQLSGSGER